MPYSNRAIQTVLFALLLIISACGTTEREVTVVERAPDVAAVDSLLQPTAGESVLRIGELNPVKGFDPLYAVNTASRRAILQLYEGLVRYDGQNEIQPAGAREWEVSDDSLTYTFKLKRDIFFHDSEVFHNGVGRRVTANDYKRAFHRMASPEVPSMAAELFMDHILGFEAYYLEQREVYFEEDRYIDEIEGITVENDTTLVIELNEPSDTFLKKLATPYAVVYPREAIADGQHQFRWNPVGTGPFKMANAVGDSIFVMQKSENFSRSTRPEAAPNIDRLEILHIPNESRLFQQMSLDNLDMIVDLGPQMISELVDDDGELHQAYEDNYQLKVNDRSEAIRVSFNRNNRYRLQYEHAKSLINQVSGEELRDRLGIPSLALTMSFEQNSMSYFEELKERFPSDEADEALPIAFQRDTDVGVIAGSMFAQLSDDLKLSFMPSRIQSRDIFMYIQRPMLSYPDQEVAFTDDELLKLNYDRHLIKTKETEGVELNDMAWWLDLTQVRVPEIEDPEL